MMNLSMLQSRNWILSCLPLQIEEIALLNTTLMRYDGAKVVYPNPKMNADMVVNLNRSGNRNESVKVIKLYLPEGFALAVDNSCLPISKSHGSIPKACTSRSA